jgi:peroxiredoxin
MGLAALSIVAWLTPAPAAAAAAPPPASLLLQGPREGIAAPDFSLPDLAGKRIRLKDLRGNLVFLDFFATWCVPCRLEMPALERLHRAYRDKGSVVLAVDILEDAETVRAFTQGLRLSFPALLDEDGSVACSYGIRPVPATYLIGRDGKIVWRAFGAQEWDSSDARQCFSWLPDGRKRR